ncbi:unnamed protein product [Paramecium sonneborni]|uniref:Uncharacterized protein n=1 Tax=Paramecium sonneborni TaxID=65129 RepID=A0A8S1NIM3_9CILI|nr:unnamed protein product [Paramecium sonneborni]CAD8090242.1 unnamed protein product [Paramecium sonneborni]
MQLHQEYIKTGIIIILNPLILATMDKLKKIIVKESAHFKMQDLTSLFDNKMGCLSQRMKYYTLEIGLTIQDMNIDMGRLQIQMEVFMKVFFLNKISIIVQVDYYIMMEIIRRRI